MVAVMEVSEKDIETLRAAIAYNPSLNAVSDAGRILDRLSPAPEPEVDEATVWARKVLMARAEGFSADTEWQSAAVCQVLSELIASKDAEISHWYHLAVGDATGLERAESELAALRAENERLKADNMPPEGYKNLYIGARDCIFDANKLGRLEDGWLLLENVNVLVTPKAAERNTDEPATDTAPVVEVTQADATLVDNLLSYCDSYKLATWSPLYHEVATFRTEAEARGRRQALEEAIASFETKIPIRFTSIEIVDELRRMPEVK